MHSGHSRIHHTRHTHTSPYCQPTDDSPTHGHPTNSPYPPFHHTKSFMGKQSMAQDTTAHQSVSVTRDPGAGTNHLPCQQRICQSLRPRNHSVDHTLMHKTLVRQRHCTWSCQQSIFRISRSLQHAHHPQLPPAVYHQLSENVHQSTMHIRVL